MNQEAQGETALHLAAVAKLLAPIKLLLAHGADINVKNGYAQTPLHLAFYAAEPKDIQVTEVAQYLVEQGALINVMDLNNNTPLHYGVIKNCPKTTRFMEKRGGDPEIRNWLYGKNRQGKQVDMKGVTPLDLNEFLKGKFFK